MDRYIISRTTGLNLRLRRRGVHEIGLKPLHVSALHQVKDHEDGLGSLKAVVEVDQAGVEKRRHHLTKRETTKDVF